MGNSQRLIIYLLSFAVFLVVKRSSNGKHISKTSSHIKENTAKKVESKVKRPSSSKHVKNPLDTEQLSNGVDGRAELDLKALPISIRRILPNGLYQDISIDILK